MPIIFNVGNSKLLVNLTVIAVHLQLSFKVNDSSITLVINQLILHVKAQAIKRCDSGTYCRVKVTELKALENYTLMSCVENYCCSVVTNCSNLQDLTFS